MRRVLLQISPWGFLHQACLLLRESDDPFLAHIRARYFQAEPKESQQASAYVVH